MAAILSYSNKLAQAKAFIDNHKSTNVLYYGIGHSVPWTNETNPPAPVASIFEEKTVFGDLLGAHLVNTKDIVPVVPRKDWTINTEYFLKDDTIANTHSIDFYILTSNNEVYLCNSKTSAGTLSTVEPTGTGVGGIVDTGDGYTWKFLYDINAYDAANLMNTTWMPVNYSDHISTLQTSSGDTNAIRTLDANAVLVYTKIGDLDLPSGITYRQVSIIENPLEANSNPATAPNYSQPADPTNPDWLTDSGSILYIDNRPPITRNIGQNEEFFTVLEF